ncbi:MAG: SCO family protein [Chloroflexi bacterium]|nr:SCO family protein [Chloroflexota bacterium]
MRVPVAGTACGASASAPRLALLAVLLLGLLVGCKARVPVIGTDIGGAPAPDFSLVDQNGQRVQLAALRGQPVVLTFLYTDCPDVCPLTAQKLRQTAELLGGEAERVAMLAVSVDPEHDDVAAAQAFVRVHDLEGRLHYLLGTRQELSAVWAAYYIHAAPPPPDADPATRAAYARQRGVHTDATYILDKQGQLRFLVRSDFDPAALAATLHGLLRE